METPAELETRIQAQLTANSNFGIVNGIFGDMEDCNGILELPVIYPEEGGVKFRVFGCSYLFKGFPETSVVEGLGLAKAMISALPREFIVKYWPSKLALAWTILFNRKKFIHLAHVWFATIYINEVKKLNIPEKNYNGMAKEIKRVVYKLIGEKKDQAFGLFHADFRVSTKWELSELVAKVTEFLCLFLELDSAYRFRLQDILENLDKENLRKSVSKEVRRLLTLMASREKSDGGIRYKIEGASKLATLLMFLNKDIKNFVRDFLLELDIEKVKLDEDDWYFCLKRHSYTFRGIPLEERIREKERIDKERGHILLKISSTYDMQCTSCKSQLSVIQADISKFPQGLNIVAIT